MLCSDGASRGFGVMTEARGAKCPRVKAQMVLLAVPALRLPELSCHRENNDSHQLRLATSPCCHLHPSARDPSHGTSTLLSFWVQPCWKRSAGKGNEGFGASCTPWRQLVSS